MQNVKSSQGDGSQDPATVTDESPRPALEKGPLSDEALEVLIASFEEDARLQSLSDLELIRETLQDEVADDPRVNEMMGRIYPRWFDGPDMPELPDPPRSVCIALPFDVAHEVVAFSECHCGELIAGTGNTVKANEDARPCLYCACNAALFRATKDPMYASEAGEEQVDAV